MEGDDYPLKVQDNRVDSDAKKNSSSACSGHFKKCEIPRSGGSILQLMEELIRVGQVIGYNMEGCTKNIGDIIDYQGVNDGNR